MPLDPQATPPLLATGGYIGRGNKPHWLAMRDMHWMARMLVDEYGGRSFLPAQYVMASMPCHDDNPVFLGRSEQEEPDAI